MPKSKVRKKRAQPGPSSGYAYRPPRRRGPAPADGRFDMPREDALWDGASNGDTVTAIEWNGAVVRIIDGGVAGDTAAAPAEQTVDFTAWFASSLVWVLATALFLLRLLQLERGFLTRWSRALVVVNPVMALGMMMFAFGTFIGSMYDSVLAVLVAGTAMFAFGALLVAWSWQRDR